MAHSHLKSTPRRARKKMAHERPGDGKSSMNSSNNAVDATIIDYAIATTTRRLIKTSRAHKIRPEVTSRDSLHYFAHLPRSASGPPWSICPRT